MNPRGKHFIDAVDPDENQVNNPDQQVKDVAEPVEPQWETKGAPTPQPDEKPQTQRQRPMKLRRSLVMRQSGLRLMRRNLSIVDTPKSRLSASSAVAVSARC